MADCWSSLGPDTTRIFSTLPLSLMTTLNTTVPWILAFFASGGYCGTAFVRRFREITWEERVICFGVWDELLLWSAEIAFACRPSASAVAQVARPNAAQAATMATRHTPCISFCFSMRFMSLLSNTLVSKIPMVFGVLFGFPGTNRDAIRKSDR